MPSDPIAKAQAHGAKFEQAGSQWLAVHRKRGRPIPLVQLQAPTQREAAEMYLQYFHLLRA